MPTNDSGDIRFNHIETIFINTWILEGVGKMFILHLKKLYHYKWKPFVLFCLINAAGNISSLFYIDQVANLIYFPNMHLILINLLYDLWPVEEPYPYTNSSGKHRYSLAVIHSSMQKW